MKQWVQLTRCILILFLIGDPLNVVFMTAMLLLAMGFDTEQATVGIRNSIKNN